MREGDEAEWQFAFDRLFGQ